MPAVANEPGTRFSRLPLRAGDRLTQNEFHKRYEAMPSQFRAELLDGVVIVPSPVGFEHSTIHAALVCWLAMYEIETPGTLTHDNVSTILGDDCEVQPDALLVLTPDARGQTQQERIGIIGAPELIGEVAQSSLSYDLGVKKRRYEANGVLEYLVVALLEDDVHWFRLIDGKYVRISPDPDGVYRSTTFPGLWLDPRALLDNRKTDVLRVLRQGLASPEHAAFRARLG